jgi:hypothetical protein
MTLHVVVSSSANTTVNTRKGYRIICRFALIHNNRDFDPMGNSDLIVKNR